MKKREPSIDLLRCLALFLVIGFHFFLKNGYYYEQQVGVWMLAANSFRWLSVSCIGIFIMITGYLKSQEPVRLSYYRSIPVILTAYFLAAAVSIPIRHFLFGEAHDFFTWFVMLFNFSAVSYGWYVPMYIGLLLISPIINLALKQINEKKQILWLAVPLLIATSLSGATPLKIMPDYWYTAYPLTFYTLGAIVRKFQPKIKPIFGISLALGTAFLMGLATLLSTDGILSEALTWRFGDIWSVIIVVSLFLALYRCKPGKVCSKIFSRIACGCYGGYLLSALLDVLLYPLFPQWHTPSKYPLLFLSATVPIYIISLSTGIICDFVSKKIVKAIYIN